MKSVRIEKMFGGRRTLTDENVELFSVATSTKRQRRLPCAHRGTGDADELIICPRKRGTSNAMSV